MATNLLSIYTQYQLLNCVKQNHYYILSSFSWDVDFPVDRPTHSGALSTGHVLRGGIAELVPASWAHCQTSVGRDPEPYLNCPPCTLSSHRGVKLSRSSDNLTISRPALHSSWSVCVTYTLTHARASRNLRIILNNFLCLNPHLVAH